MLYYALQLSLFISMSVIQTPKFRLDFLEFGFQTEKSVWNPNCLETGRNWTVWNPN